MLQQQQEQQQEKETGDGKGQSTAAEVPSPTTSSSFATSAAPAVSYDDPKQAGCVVGTHFLCQAMGRFGVHVLQANTAAEVRASLSKSVARQSKVLVAETN